MIFDIPEDGRLFYRHYPGGLEAIEVGDNEWLVGPVLLDGLVKWLGPMSGGKLSEIAQDCHLRPLAFESSGWVSSRKHSKWSPIVAGRKSQMRSPADLWTSIAGNLLSERLEPHTTKPPIRQFVATVENGGHKETVSRYIGLSLRGMDVAMKEICNFYHEQLFAFLHNQQIDGSRISTSADDALFANVHSFFLHFGSGRDYLAQFIALELGLDHTRTDAMNRLRNKISDDSFDQSPILKVLSGCGYLLPSSEGKGWELAGWWKSATDLRNLLIHKRPYGSKIEDRLGGVAEVNAKLGIYRYERRVDFLDQAVGELLDLLLLHYENCNQLFLKAAVASGEDSSIFVFTEKDILSRQSGGT